ncbi:MAG: hypothetical protein J6Q70_03185 [Clostridia bacterium]|nr:hypothetical protein [Clostridia bacterium]
MIKGARKQMIVVRTCDSRYFDEAYFVLRKNAQNEQKSQDILKEANRILAETAPNFSVAQKPKGNRWLFFAAGSICGVVLSILMAVLLF